MQKLHLRLHSRTATEGSLKSCIRGLIQELYLMAHSRAAAEGSFKSYIRWLIQKLHQRAHARVVYNGPFKSCNWGLIQRLYDSSFKSCTWCLIKWTLFFKMYLNITWYSFIKKSGKHSFGCHLLFNFIKNNNLYTLHNVWHY